jgi:hypothetical protein
MEMHFITKSTNLHVYSCFSFVLLDRDGIKLLIFSYLILFSIQQLKQVKCSRNRTMNL